MMPHMQSLKSIKILLVEDSRADALLIEKSLTKSVAETPVIRWVENLSAALVALGEMEFDVVLLDLSLPDAVEFSGLQSIQNMAPKIPVIMLTGHLDEEMAFNAVKLGAQDYLFKDKADGPMIKRAIQYAIQRKQFESVLITQANFDTLTGLSNRILFESQLDKALERIKRMGNGVAVFFIDLDKFKEVNDTFGHTYGDHLLQQVAQRLKESVRAYDTVARFGGDEFALLIEGIDKAAYCETIAQKIIAKISEPFIIEDKTIDIGVSIGISMCLAGEDTSHESLIDHADEAMYDAKTAPHSDYRFYSAELHEKTLQKRKSEAVLKK